MRLTNLGDLMSKRRAGLLLMTVGMLAAVSGLALGGYNLWDNQRAGVEADTVLKAIVLHRESVAPTAESYLDVLPDPQPDPSREMPVLEVDGKRYIGTISIPAVDIELPVQESWSLLLLKTAPCRYMGSVYQGDLILCAHNYAAHFGRLKNLQPGDGVTFTDVDGNEFHYIVAQMESIAGTAVEEMESGEWDLTLFTCTLDGQARVTVRCNLLDNEE